MSDPKKLETLLAELPEFRAPAGWQDRVRAAIVAGTPVSDIRPRPSRRPLWITSGSVVAAAAAAAIYFRVIHRPGGPAGMDRPTIAVQVKTHEPMAGALAASVGDTVVITAVHADELRVYRAGTLVARCPGDAACRRGPGELELELVVTTRGALSAIAFRPALPEVAAASSPSSLDADLARAAQVQSQMALSASIDVL